MYIVIEMQTNGDKTAILTKTAAEKNQADSVFFQTLAAAAISSVEIHSVALLSEYGFLLRRETYEHRKEAAE